MGMRSFFSVEYLQLGKYSFNTGTIGISVQGKSDYLHIQISPKGSGVIHSGWGQMRMSKERAIQMARDILMAYSEDLGRLGEAEIRPPEVSK